MTIFKFDGHDDHVSNVHDDIEYTAEGIVDTKDDDGADDDNNEDDDDLLNIPIMTTTTMMMTICSIFL